MKVSIFQYESFRMTLPSLTHSEAIDAEIDLQSLSGVFGFVNLGPHRSAYRHTTE